MRKTEPDRELFLAVPRLVYIDFFGEPVGQLMIEEEKLHIIVFNPEKQEVVQWIP